MPSEMDSQKKSLPAIAKINNWATMTAEAPYNQLKQIIFRKVKPNEVQHRLLLIIGIYTHSSERISP